MAAPLDGVRVLEVANWLAAPSAAALMADLGADVVKVEPPGGDIFRGFVLQSLGYDYPFETNYAFELDNRGKRSVTVALDKPGGPELVRRMAKDCDIFITNLIQARRSRYGLTYDDIRAVNPTVVYTSFSGYGTRGPDANKAGFDYAAFWARSGVMGLMGEPPSPPPLCRGGQGDHSTSLNILAAVLAALRLRDRTGEGQHVEVNLYQTGIWTIGGDYSAALKAHQHPPRHNREEPPNPIWNSYQLADNRWVLLVMPVPDPVYWPRFCEMIGKPDWITHERYATLASRRAHSRELTAQISAIFKQHDMAYWKPRLDKYGLIWAPVSELTEVINDPQAREMGVFATVEHPEYGPYETLNTPFAIYGSDVGPRGPAPAPGAHTFEVLEELGVSSQELDRLATDGVIG